MASVYYDLDDESIVSCPVISASKTQWEQTVHCIVWQDETPQDHSPFGAPTDDSDDEPSDAETFFNNKDTFVLEVGTLRWSGFSEDDENEVLFTGNILSYLREVIMRSAQGQELPFLIQYTV